MSKKVSNNKSHFAANETLDVKGNVYVISDIHGMGNKFHEMLDKIHFNENDYLYILGDLIDRGPDGIKLMLEVSEMNNVCYMLGNHELMFLEVLLMQDEHMTDTVEYISTFDNWYNGNGGKVTYDAYLKLSSDDQDKILDILRRAYLFNTMILVNSKVLLTHAFPKWDNDIKCADVWFRPTLSEIACIETSIRKVTHDVDTSNIICITGHTPTLYYEELGGIAENNNSYQFQVVDNSTITKNNIVNWYDIDCGAPYGDEGSRLACVNISPMIKGESDELIKYYV